MIQFEHLIRQIGRYSKTIALLDDHLYIGIIKGHAKDPMASFCLSEMLSYRHDPDPRIDIAIESTQDAFIYINRALKRKQIRLCVVDIPSKAQVLKSFREILYYEDDRRAREFVTETIRAGYSFDSPDRVLREMMERLDIEYVSLLGLFRENHQERVFFNLDSHWTPDGQRLAGKKIVDILSTVRAY